MLAHRRTQAHYRYQDANRVPVSYSRVAGVLDAQRDEVQGLALQAVRPDADPEAGPVVREDRRQALQHDAAGVWASVLAAKLLCSGR